ncbi:hypothetical protein A2153_05310 [Candidatus Gottesmanbacteria bacterium RBG_16_38_7b]|uniref:Methyltransferase type 11 domain-containing protein n=1 Tax=Candidatus Gottesmanbacteria bacterium RBG_16_38_7b TaxID=1798372 RepID=A0A1F5YJ58_9BACT|nr:MAG: hypothetical protein A2153_05310 [Candidatus Gottesmanbacteria bacterium RBG_16_38_7b]
MRNNRLINLLKGLFFWQGWHPEVALRYLPVVSEIKKLGRQPQVLDIGSGGLGIAPYIGYKVTGCDIKFRPPFHHLLDRIKARAEKLPFADRVFDVVVSVDTLEHLNKNSRQKAIQEMLRLAEKLVCLAVPCGQPAYLQDKMLSKYYRKKFKKKYQFFEEQLKLGLPEKEEIVMFIEKAAVSWNKKIKISILNNENLKLREFLMKGWMTKNILLTIFFRKILLLAIPILRRMNNKPVYRQIFIIKIL